MATLQTMLFLSKISKLLHRTRTSSSITQGPLTDEEISSFAEAGLTDSELSLKGGAYFPVRYVLDFFRFIEAHPDKLNVVTYADLDVPKGDGFKDGYSDEYADWRKRTHQNREQCSQAHVLIQYDIDSRPERMNRLIAEPAHNAVPANIMIFNRRIDRRHLKNTGEVQYTPYELNEALLRKRQSEGFLIGYHTNAYEQSGHNMEKAMSIFDRDMTELHDKYGVEYFSAHGGVPDADGINNNKLDFHPDWVDRAVWVHNGINMKFAGAFSDGGHNSPQRNPAKRDLRDFVRMMKPGERYRILIHPQYYDERFQVSKRYRGTPWYDEMLRNIHDQPDKSLWDDVKLQF